MNRYILSTIAILVIISLDEINAQGPTNLQVYKSSCIGGNEWSGWVNDARPCFYFTFPETFIMAEVFVTNVPYGGTYEVTYTYNTSGSCNQWPEAHALATGRYIWNVRVYYYFTPSSQWMWSPATWGGDFYVDVTPPNPPIVTDNDCGGNHTDWPAWTTHTSPYFTWSDPGDAGSGVSFYQASVNGGGWSTVSTLWHPTYEGNLTFVFRSVDNAGNASSPYVLYVRIDNTAPPAPSVTEAHCGLPGIWTAHTSPLFFWSSVFDAGFPTSGSGINRYEVSVNEGEWSSVTAPWHPAYGTGQYNFRFRTIDNVSLASGPNIISGIYIDDTPPDPPVVTEQHCGGSTSENPPWTSHKSPYFTWSIPADAGSGILPNGFKVSVNSGEWTTITTDWHPEYENGSYTFDFQSIDRVGHTSISYRLYVHIHVPVKIYVKQNASGSNNGSSWINAFTDLQSALSAALGNDTIWVAAGTYKPSVDKTGNSSPADLRTKVFQLVSDVPVYGGFSGTETKLKDRDPGSNETVLSGDIGIESDNTDNSYSVVRGVNNSTLDGLSVTGGNGDGTISLETDLGGGIVNYYVSNVKIRNCIFQNNFSKQGGGAGNYFCTDSIIFRNCKFLTNSGYNGGAIGNWNTRAYVTNSIFAGNSTSSANSYGAAIFNWGSGSTSQISNCTFYNNTDVTLRGAVHSRGVTSTATNCIFWGNSANDIINSSGGGCILTYSCIEQSGYAGSNGNISSNPQFLDAVNSDFHLTSGSPCIDAGNGDKSPVYDLDNNLRFDHPDVVNTGTGSPLYSDLGVYEFMLTTESEILETEAVKIFPNPTNGIFSIIGVEIKKIEIYNISGVLIYSNRNYLPGEINIGQQPEGVYIIKIETTKNLVIRKVIIK